MAGDPAPRRLTGPQRRALKRLRAEGLVHAVGRSTLRVFNGLHAAGLCARASRDSDDFLPTLAGENALDAPVPINSAEWQELVRLREGREAPGLTARRRRDRLRDEGLFERLEGGAPRVTAEGEAAVAAYERRCTTLGMRRDG